jgi:hypothetical protein
MKVVHKIFTILMLMFITVSSVGISFYLHQCGCRNTTLFSFETGYSGPDEFCCCSVQTPTGGESSCCDEVEKEECCKDQYYFILVPFGPENITTVVKLQDGKISGTVIPGLVLMSGLSNLCRHAPRPNPPPFIVSGKQFVYFTHQIKIPCPIA